MPSFIIVGYVWQILGTEGLFAPHHLDPWAASKQPILNRVNEKTLPARKYFYSSTKDGKVGDDSKISDGHISNKDYLTCENIWYKFNMKNMGHYHDLNLKKDCYQ